LIRQALQQGARLDGIDVWLPRLVHAESLAFAARMWHDLLVRFQSLACGNDLPV
jgi:hypothetical protein